VAQSIPGYAHADAGVLPPGAAITLPPIRTIQSTIMPAMPANSNTTSAEMANALQLSQDNLTKELLRITALLSTREPHAGDYADLLNRAQKVSEILNNLRR
jgi:hypothetical protein